MKKRYIVILLLIIVFAFFIKNAVKEGDKLAKASDYEQQKDTAYVPKEYLKLFVNPQKLSLINTSISKRRSPITDCYYDNKKLFIEIYKIGVIGDMSLKQYIKETFDNAHITYYSQYLLMDNQKDVDIFYKLGEPGSIPGLQININGVNTKTIIKNDSIAYYTSKLKQLFIKYDHTASQDIYISTKNKGTYEKASEIIFLKKGNLLYYLFCCYAKNDHLVKPIALNDIIVK